MIILLIMAAMKSFLKNKVVQAVMTGLTACVIGVILATGCWLLYQNGVSPLFREDADIRPPVLAAVLAALWFGLRTKPKLKKYVSPIRLIIVSAVFGILIYSF